MVMMEKVLAALLSRIVGRGTLTVVAASGKEYHLGDGTGEEVRVRFADRGAERVLLLNPDLRLGELFMDGRLVVERGTIYDFLALVLGGTSALPRSWPSSLDRRPSQLAPSSRRISRDAPARGDRIRAAGSYTGGYLPSHARGN